MTLHHIFMIIVAILIFVVLPICGVVTFWSWLNTKPADRPVRRGGSMGGVLLPLDRLIRPSAEHRIEAEHRVVTEDADLGGE